MKPPLPTCLRWTMMLMVAVLLSGCGLHMAGRSPLPAQLKQVYVDFVDPYHVDVPPLQTALIDRLKRSGADVVSSPQKARSILRITGLHLTREAVAIGSDGRAVEYRLIVGATYALAADGRIVLSQRSLSDSSEYSFSANQILAKEEEESRLEKYVENQLAELILLQINTRLAQLPPERLPGAPSDALPASASSSSR